MNVNLDDVVLEKGGKIDPMASFSGFPNESLRKYFEKSSGFRAPSLIQAFAWPCLLRGDDLVAIADTGSGKTLGFLAPIIASITTCAPTDRKRSRSPSAKCVVLAPTRELAQQISGMGEPLCSLFPSLKIVSLVGGVSKSDQLASLNGAESLIIVATPGRLNDLVDSGHVDLSVCSYVVLDEADRMLDMGFEPQIRRIFQSIPSNRQTCMFSATWPSEVQALAREFVRVDRMTQIRAGASSKVQNGTANESVKQEVRCVPTYHDKKRTLINILQEVIPSDYTNEQRPFRVLIFMLYKKTCQKMFDDLWNAGWYVTVLHGDMSQAARNQSIDDFRTGKYPLLVATDVAARGLDVKDVRLVVNVEMPLVIEDYVHRIGRTGRAGKEGHAITLFCENDDKEHAQDLRRILLESNQLVSKEFEQIAKRAPPPKRLTKKSDPFKLGHIDVDKGASGAFAEGHVAEESRLPKKIRFD